MAVIIYDNLMEIGNIYIARSINIFMPLNQ